MRPTLLYIPETLFGLPVFGWGLGLGILAIALILSHIYQYVKHRKISDIGSSLALLGIGGVILLFVVPNLIEPGHGVPIRGYGTCLVVAIFAAFFLVLHLARRQNIPADKIVSLCFWTVIVGIIGARLFYVTEYWQEMLCEPSGQLLPFREASLNVLNFAQGGLVVFGSIIGGILAAMIFMFYNKMPMLRTFDVMAPAAALGIAIGRIGCLLNGCCFGGVTDLSWAIVFPQGSPAHVHQVIHNDTFFYGLKFDEKTIGRQKVLTVAEVQPDSEAETLGVKPNMALRNLFFQKKGQPMVGTPHTRQDAVELFFHIQKEQPGEQIQFDFFTDLSPSEVVSYRLDPGTSQVLPVHPTQIYSSFLAFLLCVTLLILGRLHFYRHREGLVLASFMILYSVGRFMIEIVRTDEDSFLGTGLTVSQNVSILFGIAGIALFVYLCRKKPPVIPVTTRLRVSPPFRSTV